MQNQTPPSGNPGEMPPNYGHPQGQPPHPGMVHMGPGMPYPPYMMFPTGGPFMYMPPHPDMPGHLSPEMMMDPHYRGPMMPYPMHPMGHPMMSGMPYPMPMNPNVPQFVPGYPNMRRESVQSSRPARSDSGSESRMSPEIPVKAPSPPSGPAAAPAPIKPVSKRLAIIDPATGQEISFKPVVVTASPPPASALTSADIVLRNPNDPKPIGIPSSAVPAPAAPAAPVSVSTAPAAPPAAPAPTTPAVATAAPAAAPAAAPTTPVVKGTRLKNAPLPKKPEVVEEPIAVKTHKVLKGIKNAPLVRKPSDTPPLIKGGRLRLVNKPLAAAAAAPAALPQLWPLPRELMLRHMPTSKPDRHAPLQTNVFPSELLGLRTCPHGDPGLAIRNRRAPLQKTTSSVSTSSRDGWRKGGIRAVSKPVRKLVGITRPSERGFKIIDQSSLSEKEKLRRQTMSLLNKITVDSFKAITAKISEIEITQPWQMDVVIGLIFDKAVVEHAYSEMYAEMCKTLRNTWPELEGVDQETGQSVPVTFARAIIEKCQVEFDNIPETLELTEAEIAKAKGDPQDLENAMHKKKERILGNMKFIAQLFLMRILSSRVVRSVVEQLLFRTDEPEEHYIECVSILLHNIGSTLFETESGRAYIAQFADRMTDLTGREIYGKRIKFLMTDLVEASSVGWDGRQSRHVVAAKSKEEVRKDAQEELNRKTPAIPVRGYQRAPAYKPVAVLKRDSAPAPAVARRDSIPEEPWSDDEDDDVSEYAPGDSEEEGFIEVVKTNSRRVV